MRRWIFSTIVTLILLMMTGCFSSSGSSGSTGSYMTGTEGISMRFVHNNPPSVIYVDRTFAEDTPIEVEAFNRGTAPSANVETFFAGFDSSIVSIPDLSRIDFSGEGAYRTRYNPEGGYSTDSTRISVGNMHSSDVYDFNLRLVYCYDYMTRVGINICVDPNPNRVNRDDSCSPGTVSTSGQGAPVGVSSIETTSMPGLVRLKINIRHYGQGELLRSSAPCRGVSLREDQDYIDFTNPTLGGIPGNCVTPSPLKLRNGQGSIICTFPLDRDGSSYRTILEMELSNYKIKDSIQRNIRIINEQDTIY
ncbi:MAG: hypothetical protein ACMXYG_01605 [Candidatus Woesearchaeota archaeon]